MPRQNTSPSQFPPSVLHQIDQLAQQLVRIRKARGQTQAQWAAQLGISQPTMARLERGDPAIATATYVACLCLANPDVNLLSLLPASEQPAVAAPDAPSSQTEAQSAANGVADEFAQLLAQWTAPAL